MTICSFYVIWKNQEVVYYLLYLLNILLFNAYISIQMKQDISLFAYYLPQYYEIEFNNKYWGQGHTEWTVAENAKPLFKGHYQPHVPADLGFYNLLMPRARKRRRIWLRNMEWTDFVIGITGLEMEKPSWKNPLMQ